MSTLNDLEMQLLILQSYCVDGQRIEPVLKQFMATVRAFIVATREAASQKEQK